MYLFDHVARQEPESFPRLDRRPRQDDPLGRLRRQAHDRHRDREIGLAGASRTDAEGEIVRPDRLEVEPLVEGLRADDLVRGDLDRALFEERAQLLLRVVTQEPARGAHLLRVELEVLGLQLRHLRQQPLGPLDPVRRTLDLDLVAARGRTDAEDLLHRTEVLIVGAEQGGQIVGVDDDTLGDGLHSGGHAACVGRRTRVVRSAVVVIETI